MRVRKQLCYRGAGDPNSGSHTCRTSPGPPTKLSSQEHRRKVPGVSGTNPAYPLRGAPEIVVLEILNWSNHGRLLPAPGAGTATFCPKR